MCKIFAWQLNASKTSSPYGSPGAGVSAAKCFSFFFNGEYCMISFLWELVKNHFLITSQNGSPNTYALHYETFPLLTMKTQWTQVNRKQLLKNLKPVKENHVKYPFIFLSLSTLPACEVPCWQLASGSLRFVRDVYFYFSTS